MDSQKTNSKAITLTMTLICMLLSSSFVFAVSWINKPTNSGSYPDASDRAVKISKNGRYIAFTSSSSNLVGGDVNLSTDLFIKDTQTSEITLVSRTSAGNQLSSSTTVFSRPTSDGQTIAFVSDDDSLPMANGTKLLYTKNLITQVVTAIKYNSGLTPITVYGVYMTDDASFIYFATENDIVANDTNGKNDIYRVDLNNGTFDLVSIALSGQSPVYTSYMTRLLDVSEDGNYVIFAANSGEFHSAATTATTYFGYIRNMQFNTTQIYTVDHLSAPAGIPSSASVANSVVSNSGKVYFCSSQANLVLGDNNGEEDLFKYVDGVVSRLEFSTVPVEITDRGCRYFARKNLSIAADDSYLLFPHTSQDLHPDATGDNYLYKLNLATNDLQLISQSNGTAYSVTGLSDFSVDSETVVFTSSDRNIIAGAYGTQSFSLNVTSNTLAPVSQAYHPALVQNSSISVTKISDDQNHIFYTSSATNAVADSNINLYSNLYYFNRISNSTTIIAENTSNNIDISADGRYVVFRSRLFHPITTIVLSDSTIFLYDTQTGLYTQIAIGANPSVNNEGNVVFESTESTLVNNDNNGVADIFIFNLASQSIDRVNVASNGDEAQGGYSGEPQIAGEGLSTWIVFESNANNLVVNDNNGFNDDIFLVNWPNGNIQRVSEIGGVGGDSYSINPEISTDTSTIIFATTAENLVGAPLDRVQLMKYDRVLNSMQLISQSASNNPSTKAILNYGISANGQYISFSTDAALLAGDFNDKGDIYVHDANTNALRIVVPNSINPYVREVAIDTSFSEPKLGILFLDSNSLLGDLYGIYEVAGHFSGFLYQEGGDGETLSLDLSGTGQVVGHWV